MTSDLRALLVPFASEILTTKNLAFVGAAVGKGLDMDIAAKAIRDLQRAGFSHIELAKVLADLIPYEKILAFAREVEKQAVKKAAGELIKNIHFCSRATLRSRLTRLAQANDLKWKSARIGTLKSALPRDKDDVLNIRIIENILRSFEKVKKKFGIRDISQCHICFETNWGHHIVLFYRESALERKIKEEERRKKEALRTKLEKERKERQLKENFSKAEKQYLALKKQIAKLD